MSDDKQQQTRDEVAQEKVRARRVKSIGLLARGVRGCCTLCGRRGWQVAGGGRGWSGGRRARRRQWPVGLLAGCGRPLRLWLPAD